MEKLIEPFGVKCVDATKHPSVWPANVKEGWPLKPFAIINCPFREVLLLDADNVALRDPEFLFDLPAYKEHGAVFWPDTGSLSKESTAWALFDVPYREEPEFESGQVLVDKSRCWSPLLLTMWYNEHNALYYRHIYGDKETFHFAFRRLNAPFAMPAHPMQSSGGAFYQHDFDGRRLFQHRHGDKWNLRGRNKPIPDFQLEETCLGFLADLARQWDGRIDWLRDTQARAEARLGNVEVPSIRLLAIMASCPERHAACAETMRSLAATDWPPADVLLLIDQKQLPTKIENLTHTAWRGLQMALESNADYMLFLEDDLSFNSHWRANLTRWRPLARGEVHIGSLCNLGFRELAWDVPGDAYLVHPSKVQGTQAVLLSRQMLRFCFEHWFEGPLDLDLKLGHLAAQARQPIFFHCPSLVQHTGQGSTLNHEFREAFDFEPDWESDGSPALRLETGLFSNRAPLV
jgi:hypothetical protein